MNAIGERLYEQYFGRPKIASPECHPALISESAAAATDLKFSVSS